MKRLLLTLSVFFLLTGCQSASQMLTPGTFNAANSTTSSSEQTDKSGGMDGSTDNTQNRVVAQGPATIDPKPDSESTGRNDVAPPDTHTIPNPNPNTGNQANRAMVNQGTDNQQNRAFYAQTGTGTNPIGTKPDGEAVQVGRRHTRFRYGPNFALINEDGYTDTAEWPLTEWPLNDDGSLDMKLLLENNVVIKESPDPLHVPPDYGWLPQEDGPQIRVLLLPTGRSQWQAKYSDAVIFKTHEGYNVSFAGLHPTESGVLHFFVIEKPHASVTDPFGKGILPPPPGYETTSDFNPGDFVKFANKDAFDAFWDNGTRFLENENATARRFVGAFKITVPQRVDMMRKPSPPPAAPTTQERPRYVP